MYKSSLKNQDLYELFANITYIFPLYYVILRDVDCDESDKNF